jgi:SAM-dependent methyltransferase
VSSLDERQLALVGLGQALRAGGYRFVTPTPRTHALVNARPENLEARSLRDIFGWSRPFAPAVLPEALRRLGQAAQILEPAGGNGRWRSSVRFSTLPSFAGGGDLLFVHSAFPTEAHDSVFFGPDSYRFAAFLRRAVWKAERLVDVGCGSGVGGIVLAPRVRQVILADVNPRALAFAQVNRALAGLEPAAVELQVSDVLASIDGAVDAVIANPPYLTDAEGRLYRDGGGALGLGLGQRILVEAFERLSPGGTLALYTGSPVIDGRNVIEDWAGPLLRERARTWTWEELDPDVFGEELAGDAYRHAERIAVTALVAEKA